jgi:alanine dehydrogenase
VRVGVTKEIKDGEDRIAITPAGTHELVAHGHSVLVEEGAGSGSMIADDERGVNAVRGRLTLLPVAAAHGLAAVPLDDALAENG